MASFLDSVKELITPDLVNQASSFLGENSENVTKAVGASVPALLTGLIGKAEGGGSATILNAAKEIAGSNALGDIGSIFSGGSSLLSGANSFSNLFGSQQSSGLINMLSNFAGLKSSSAGSVLGMLTPVILGVIGKHAVSNNLSSGGLASLLSSQKSSVSGALPSGFNIGNLFGSAQQAASSAVNEVRSALPAAPKRNWLWPVIIALLALLLIFYLVKGCKKTPNAATTTVDTATIMAAPDTAAIMAVPDTTTMVPSAAPALVKLADGTEINANKGGTEDVLVTCLNDATCTAGKDKWFDFDNVNFEVGSANITPQSQPQIRNIVLILKAYPKAKIKIGGYTDKTGDEAANKKLSQDRANAVLVAVRTAGANGSQLVGAEGYGSEFAKVAASASDEARRADRRIAIQLREK